jgi:photosystem II reaction center protein PsbP
MAKIDVRSQMGLLSITCLLLLLIIISIYPTRFVSSVLQSTAEQLSQLSPLSTKVFSFNNTGDSTTNNISLTFQNSSALGMTIKYPNNWKTALAYNSSLILMPPPDGDNFSEILVIAVFGINNSININQLSDRAIKNYGAHYNDFYILDLKPISFQSKPAYLLLYTYTNPTAGKIFTMDIGIKDGSKAYVISYSAEQQEYYSYLPIIDKMIDSFRLI